MNQDDQKTEPEAPHPAPQSLEFGSTDRRRGKVARLPKSVRDQINVMIQDGVTYLEIIERLGPDASALNEQNLSSWKSGGYLDWLRELQLVEALKAKHELAQAIV